MQYVFEDLVLGPYIAVSGVAEFDSNPASGDPRRHRPDIWLEGFAAKRVQLKADDAGLGAELYRAILMSLVEREWVSICAQWTDEKQDRIDAARGNAYAQHFKPE